MPERTEQGAITVADEHEWHGVAPRAAPEETDRATSHRERHGVEPAPAVGDSNGGPSDQPLSDTTKGHAMIPNALVAIFIAFFGSL
ncbi:hypothetical protein HQQ82_09600 [Rathayibacter sp. VKM Ac-2856]|uniref:hypothetical protein n=1 Tax=unclassified Rathayibacter TaxID=2609250 RepID=UPI0015631360|nr:MULTISPECIES: hypothetical protein [unclassified Rathayibacter]NQX05052.1 hypothetical protein [Rathayibacter sp. VKM Ac-2858]NQX20220.1 hypothetical protein [Rathayibacter sp. VKM Ac-2856]